MKHLALLIAFCFSFFAASLAQAEQEKLDYSAFKTLPVLHEGRLKPMDSFARITLKRLSGVESLDDMSASEWLALTVFDPVRAAEMNVFLIEDSKLRAKLGLQETQKLYSFKDLKAGIDQSTEDVVALLQKDQDTLSQNELDLLNVHENAALFTALMRSFSALLPLNIALPPEFQDQLQGEANFIELAKIEKPLEEHLQKIISSKGRNPSTYTSEELAIAQASFHIQTLRMAGEKSTLLRVIPATWDSAKDEWFSPWNLILSGQGSPESAFLLSQWQGLADAYRLQDAELWTATLNDLQNEIALQTNEQISAPRFEIENMYRIIKPYFWILGFYTLSFICTLSFLLKPNPAFYKAAWMSSLTGITLHATAILARIYILQRPPVGTLYESALFVSLICALASLWICNKNKNPVPLAAGMFCATNLLALAPALSPDADNLEVLVAVLNTNFWLTTHVLCITIGYGLCILTACVAHAGLFSKALQKNNVTWLKLQQLTYHISLVALFFMSVGTILGGIWADQSWGRFWGWDPKENGALLIVLWLIWALHGRVSGHFKPLGFMSTIALLNLIVALSWLGVNLLNVGLHSYGFTDGMAANLLVFGILQSLLVAGLYGGAKLRGEV